MNACGGVGRSLRTYFVRVIIPPAIRDDPVVPRELWDLVAPHPIALQPTVNEDYWFSLSLLNIGERIAVDETCLVSWASASLLRPSKSSANMRGAGIASPFASSVKLYYLNDPVMEDVQGGFISAKRLLRNPRSAKYLTCEQRSDGGIHNSKQSFVLGIPHRHLGAMQGLETAVTPWSHHIPVFDSGTRTNP
jgi:hypothetical protein